MFTRKSSTVTSYAYALLAVALATLLRFALAPILELRAPYILYFPTVTLCAWFWGMRAGLLSTALSAIAAQYFFTLPQYSLQTSDPTVIAQLIIFSLGGALISLLAEKLGQAAQKIEESQAHLQLATASARAGTWEWNIKTGEVLWSPIHKELWGYEPTPEPISYDDWARLIQPDDLRRAEGAIEECLRGKKIYDIKYRITPQGSTETRWIRSTPVWRGRSDWGRCLFPPNGDRT